MIRMLSTMSLICQTADRLTISQISFAIPLKHVAPVQFSSKLVGNKDHCEEGSRSVCMRRHAVAEPPVRTRPPDVGDAVANSRAEWTECLLEDHGHEAARAGDDSKWTIAEGSQPGAATTASAIEDVMASIKQSADAKEKSPRSIEIWVFRTTDLGDFERLLKIRSYNPTRTRLHCRERSIDADMHCNECMRLLRGGHYGSLGISVPAYPPETTAVGCLQLSKMLDVDANFESWGSPVALGELGDKQKQSAFCNSVKASLQEA